MATPNKTAVLDRIRDLADSQQSLTLVLRRGERWGWIHFSEGEVTSARTLMSHGIAAFDVLVMWWDAEMYGDENMSDEGGGGPLPILTEDLHAVGVELIAEVDAILGDEVDLSARYMQNSAAGAARGQLDADSAALLELFDGKRALVDVLDDSAYNLLWTLRATMHLAEAKLIELGN